MLSLKRPISLIMFGLLALCVLGIVSDFSFEAPVSEEKAAEHNHENATRIDVPKKRITNNKVVNSIDKTENTQAEGDAHPDNQPMERASRELMPHSEIFASLDNAENRNGPSSDPSSKSAEFIPFVPVENLTGPPIAEGEPQNLPPAIIIYNTTGP